MPSHCIPDRTPFTMYRYDICLTLLFLHLLIIWLRYTSRGLAYLIFTDAILCSHIRESSERDSSPDRIGIHRTPLSSIVIGQWEEPKQYVTRVTSLTINPKRRTLAVAGTNLERLQGEPGKK